MVGLIISPVTTKASHQPSQRTMNTHTNVTFRPSNGLSCYPCMHENHIGPTFASIMSL